MKNEDSNNEKYLREEIGEIRKIVRDLAATVEQLRENLPNVPQPTGPREEILEFLEKSERPMSIKEIAEVMGLAEATVSGYTLDLYKGGFIDRGRRLVEVSPTRRVRQLEYYVPGKKKKKWHYVD